MNIPALVPTPAPLSRRFLRLAALGLVGVASLPLVMLPTLRMLARTGQAQGMSVTTLAVVSLILAVVRRGRATP